MTFFDAYNQLRAELGAGDAERLLELATVHVKRSARAEGFLAGIVASALLAAALLIILERI